MPRTRSVVKATRENIIVIDLTLDDSDDEAQNSISESITAAPQAARSDGVAAVDSLDDSPETSPYGGKLDDISNANDITLQPVETQMQNTPTETVVGSAQCGLGMAARDCIVCILRKYAQLRQGDAAIDA